MAQPSPTLIDDRLPRTASGHEGPADADLRYRSWRLARMPWRADLYRQRLASLAMAYTPTISIITPVFNTPPDLLHRVLRSVANQSYPHWQHCLVDDGSTSPWLSDYLERLAARDSRIRFERRPSNGGIVAASNHALTLATGEFVGMVDHDDEIDPQALYAVVTRLNANPETDVFYSDFDLIDRRGRHSSGWFLPDWSPEMLLTLPIVAHLTVYRRSILENVGGWRPEFEGSQDYDLALRVTSLSEKVVHIPLVLYHWRQWERSVAGNPTAKPYAYIAAKDALVDHLQRNGISGRREDGAWLGFHTVRFDILGSPLVSVVIPAPLQCERSTAATFLDNLQQLIAEGDYAHCEVLVIVHPEDEHVLKSLASESHLPIKVTVHPTWHDTGELLNAGAAAAQGEHLLFLAAAFVPASPGWMRALLEYSQQDAVGAVGARVLTRDSAMWHAGVVLPRGVAHVIRHDTLLVNCSAVSGACFMTRRTVFERVGGFRSSAEVGHEDFDYCLRLRELGYRHLVTRRAVVRFSGAPLPEPDDQQRAKFTGLWADRLPVDPYYNPNFCQDDACFTLSLG